MLKNKRNIAYYTFIGALSASLLLLIGAYCLESFNHIIGFDGYAANGAFQLMNPLTRLAHGELLGRDFQFFHGAGVALVHFPLFMLFGQGLFGSEMSRWLTSVFLFFAITFIFCISWLGISKKSLPKVLFAFAVIALFSAYFADVITPSNSLLGVRTSMPVLIGALILLEPRLTRNIPVYRKFTIRLFDILISTALALAMLCGTEHGIYSLLAFFVISTIRHFTNLQEHRFAWQSIKPLCLYLLRVAAFTGVILVFFATIISVGHPFKLLTYAFVNVPGDQFWYFGALPQGFLSLNNVVRLLLGEPSIYPLYVMAAVALVSLWIARHFNLLSKYEWSSVGFLGLYGIFTLASFLGYFSPLGQIAGAERVMIIINTMIVLMLILHLYKKVPKKYRVYAYGAFGVLTVVICVNIVNFSITKVEPIHAKSVLKSVYHNMRGDHSELLGSAWKSRIATFQPYIENAKKDSRYPLWSTYASLYEQQNGIIHPSSGGFDYIIHALGTKNRDTYTSDFIADKPELVATLRPSYFIFEEWLWGRHADFYQYLVTHYDIVAENDSHMLWKRAPQKNSPLATQSSLSVQNNTINLPSVKTAGSRVIKVTVDYSTHALPGLNKLPRYIVQPNNTTSRIGFSLPSNTNSWSFLVVLNSAENAAQPGFLQASADGLIPGATLKIKNARYEAIPVTQEQLEYFTEKNPGL